jgi:hypothetical protein
MSNTETHLRATCRIEPAGCSIEPTITAESLALAITDYLGNHEEELEALPGLYAYDQTPDEIAKSLTDYLKVDEEGNVTITCDTTQTYCQGSDTEVAEFLCNHLSYLQTSDYMTVCWVTIDSREGSSVNFYRLGPGGEITEEHSTNP